MKQDTQSCTRNLVKRGTSVTIIGAVLLAFGMAGWLVLYSLTSGAAGLRLKLNWTAIVGFGMLLVALAFLILWLFDKLVTIRLSMQQAVSSATFAPAAVLSCGPMQ